MCLLVVRRGLLGFSKISYLSCSVKSLAVLLARSGGALDDRKTGGGGGGGGGKGSASR
jgi:hypothetical protein